MTAFQFFCWNKVFSVGREDHSIDFSGEFPCGCEWEVLLKDNQQCQTVQSLTEFKSTKRLNLGRTLPQLMGELVQLNNKHNTGNKEGNRTTLMCLKEYLHFLGLMVVFRVGLATEHRCGCKPGCTLTRFWWRRIYWWFLPRPGRGFWKSGCSHGAPLAPHLGHPSNPLLTPEK